MTSLHMWAHMLPDSHKNLRVHNMPTFIRKNELEEGLDMPRCNSCSCLVFKGSQWIASGSLWPSNAQTHTNAKKRWALKPSYCCTCTSMPLVFLIRNSAYFTSTSTRHISLMLVRRVRWGVFWKTLIFRAIHSGIRNIVYMSSSVPFVKRDGFIMVMILLPWMFTLAGFPLL